MCIQEISSSCHKQIETTHFMLESKILSKIDQLMSLVAGCDAKIKACNSSMEERNNLKFASAMQALNLEKKVGRDGEFLVNKMPILQTHISINSKDQKDETLGGLEKKGCVGLDQSWRFPVSVEDPRSWVRKCNKFFLINQVSDHLKLDVIKMFLDGKAKTWYLSYKMVKGNVS